jgi:5-hydroxyisourate hydrolase
MAKLTTHVLNLAAGIPAAGMRIELHSVDGDCRTLAASVITNSDGRSASALLEGAAFRAGRYSLTFHVAAYFRSLNVVLAAPPFLDEVVIAFAVAEPEQNYHVPLLVSPWSYSTYRGS